MIERTAKQTGGVSLFIVVFACLAVTIVTVGFVSLMIRGQQQATDTDLSNSAYDSALAGVEDAKRLALIYKQCQAAGTVSTECVDAEEAIEAMECDTIHEGLRIGTAEEVDIQSSTGDTRSAALDQAYTCVKVNFNTSNVERTIGTDATQMVELRGVAPFTSVRLSWHQRTEDGSPTMATLPAAGTPPNLPQNANWPTTAPPVLRAQVIQTSSSFNLGQFADANDGTSNSNAVFLRPVTASNRVPDSVTMMTQDPSLANMTSTNSPTATKQPRTVVCGTATYAAGDYACSTTMTLASPRGGGVRSNAYLILSSFYTASNFRVELLDASNNVVAFDGVQPLVDSTGRANDLFRRINARIEFNPDDFEYPNAALDLNDTLCKAFTVTDNPEDFTDPCEEPVE